MESLFLVVHVFLAIGVIALVLMQHGKGADAGAAFGSGASATVFGARGATSFLAKLTTSFAALFFATSLILAYIAASRPQVTSVVDVVEQQQEAPKTVAKESKSSDDLPPAAADKAVTSPAGAQDLPKMD